jgi:hypothetical protein
MASPDQGPGARLLGQSLLTLEVSTILKSNMTAEPMPPLPHALLDLAIDYCVKLEELGMSRAAIALELYGARHGEAAAGWSAKALRAQLAPTFDRFGSIRKLALALGAERAAARERESKRLASAEEVTLDRIVQACEIVMRVLQTLPRDSLLWRQLGLTREQLLGVGADRAPRLGPYPELDANDLLDIKKLWDVGTEQIVAQTTIHITGDVTMRVTPALLKPENKLLLEIHREAVATSTAYWRELLNTAVALATGAARALFGGRPG